MFFIFLREKALKFYNFWTTTAIHALHNAIAIFASFLEKII